MCSDWEHVIVVWKETTHGGNAYSPYWSPTRLLLSAHGNMTSHIWEDLITDGKTNRPKVYASWAKHAQYPKPMTNKTTLVREMAEDAYRGEDWHYDPDPSKNTKEHGEMEQ